MTLNLNPGDYIEVVSCEELQVIVRELAKSMFDYEIAAATELSCAEVRRIIEDPEKPHGRVGDGRRIKMRIRESV